MTRKSSGCWFQSGLIYRSIRARYQVCDEGCIYPISQPCTWPVSMLAPSRQVPKARKGSQYFFGMKAHVGVDTQSGLVHSLVGTAANVADVAQADQLLHGEEAYVYGEAGYIDVETCPEHQSCEMVWAIAVRPCTYKKCGEKSVTAQVYWKIEYAKTQLRAKVEYPFRVIKRQFTYMKVRYRGLAKSTAQQATLSALSNLWMVRRCLKGKWYVGEIVGVSSDEFVRVI